MEKSSIQYGYKDIDITVMNKQEIHNKIKKGYESYMNGNVQNAASAFKKFKEEHS